LFFKICVFGRQTYRGQFIIEIDFFCESQQLKIIFPDAELIFLRVRVIYDFIRFENDFPLFSFERFSNDNIPKFRKLTMSSSKDPNVGNKSAAAEVVTI